MKTKTNRQQLSLRKLCLGAVMAATLPALAQADKQAEFWAKQQNPWTQAERVEALSRLWMEAKYNFTYMYKVGTARWDSLYRATLPKVLEAKNDGEFLQLMEGFCGFLEDEHTFLQVSKMWGMTLNYFSDGWYLSTEYVDGHVIVTAVSSDKQEQLPLYSEITAVNGLPIAEALAKKGKQIAASTPQVRLHKAGRLLLHGSSYTTHEITYRTPKGETRFLTLYNEYCNGYDQLKVSRHPSAEGKLKNPFDFRWYPGDIAYIRIGTFMNNEEVRKGLNAAIAEMQPRAKKLIIDIRNNGGGNSSWSCDVAAHFIPDTEFADVRWSTPTYNAAYASWGRKQPFYEEPYKPARYPEKYARVVVPTLVLINHGTCSASENFLVNLLGQPHIRFVGSASSGSTGNPVVIPLIEGMSCRICTKKDVMPDGSEFVGRGILPHYPVPVSLQEFISGKDVVLEAALRHLEKQ